MGSTNSKVREILSNERELQLANQRLQVERQMAMEVAIKERMLAMDVARSRDIAMYFMVFTAVAAAGCVAMAIRKKQRLYVLPALPILIAAEYHYNIGFGDAVLEYRKVAEDLLNTQPELFDSALLRITLDEIESRRRQAADMNDGK